MNNMTEKYNAFADNRWYGKEFTKKGALVMMILLLLHLPIHELGHWIGYWMFGIPATFGFITEPFWACTVHAVIEPAFPVKIFASFFGGGFAGIIGLIIATKIRPALMAAVVGFSAGITEMLYVVLYYYDFTIVVASNMLVYAILHVIPVLIVFIIGLPEFHEWARSKIAFY